MKLSILLGPSTKEHCELNWYPLHGIITSTSSRTVTITAALDPTLALTHDHDPIFAKSNKKSRSVMGFQIVDVINSYI